MAKKADLKSSTKPVDVMRTVKEEYTDAQISKKATLLAAAMHDRENLKEEAKAKADSYKQSITAKETEIENYASAIYNGFEMVSRPCKLIKNFERGVREYWFDGKVVDEEPLTAHDHQLDLEVAEEKNAIADKAEEKTETPADKATLTVVKDDTDKSTSKAV